MDTDRALAYVAERRGEDIDTLRELLISAADTQEEAMRIGIDSGRITYPYPEEEVPRGSVPWQVMAHDFGRSGMTELCVTPYGVLWINSQ